MQETKEKYNRNNSRNKYEMPHNRRETKENSWGDSNWIEGGIPVPPKMLRKSG